MLLEFRNYGDVFSADLLIGTTPVSPRTILTAALPPDVRKISDFPWSFYIGGAGRGSFVPLDKT
ncbi:MAG: hypothetical protein L0387_34065 [Acidobacteria bacterium]|nr:hypothetical protein [Acidobacteriota bacterium]MCI0719402.1 hypothetical protein [Acidobacteriota bacterium]